MRFNIFLFFTLLTFSLTAQQNLPLWFSDSDFKANVNRWYQVDEFGERTYHNALFVNPDKDFSIVASFNSEAVDEAAKWGVSWGRKDAYSYYHFEINDEYAFRIGYRKGMQYNPLEPWKIKKKIIQKDNNKLEIRKTGSLLTFLINDKMVYKMPYLRFDQSGIALRSTTPKVDFESIEIYQDMGPIHLKDTVFDPQLKAENLGTNVNTSKVDKSPVISPDGKTLYFIREDAADGFGGQDIYFSEFNASKGWSLAQNIGRPINNHINNFVTAVMPDNNTLMTINSYARSSEEEILAFTHRTPEGWSTPKAKRITKLQNVGRWVSFDLAGDGKAIVFSMKRPDTYGGRDLYVSFLQPNGDFSPPRNLGNTLNTTGNEHCPFLAADGKTLYFDTDGHPGYGGRDIFMSKRLDDTWKNWSKPINLGPQINTKGADEGLVLPASGEYAYFVSDKESLGALDIFRLKMPKALRPEPTAVLTGYVIDCLNQRGIPTNIKVFKEGSTQEFATARTNPNNGEYKLALAAGEKYYILPEYNEALESSSQDTIVIDLTNLDQYEERELSPICFTKKQKPEEPIKIPIRAHIPSFESVYFDHDKYNLNTTAIQTLDKMVDTLNYYPNIKIEIIGHTDANGSDKYNWTLAIRRAASVINYLEQQGIDRIRFAFKGLGETTPIAENTTPKGRANNRRVEFKVVS